MRTSSITVLPALLPEAGWSDLAIGEGMSAVLEYERALDEPDEAVRQPIFDALRAYCRQDTLAMVQLRELLINCEFDTRALPDRPEHRSGS